MGLKTEIMYRGVTADELATLATTEMVVNLEPGADDFEDRASYHSAGCVSRRADPERGNIGLRRVIGNASGEDRYTTNRPASNLSPAELIERQEGRYPLGVYVPIELVLAALEADDMADLLDSTAHSPLDENRRENPDVGGTSVRVEE